MLTPGADSSTSGRISKTPCMRSVIASSVVNRRAQATVRECLCMQRTGRLVDQDVITLV